MAIRIWEIFNYIDILFCPVYLFKKKYKKPLITCFHNKNLVGMLLKNIILAWSPYHNFKKVFFDLLEICLMDSKSKMFKY